MAEIVRGPLLIHRYLNNESLLPEELQMIDFLVDKWRKRLASISWFMGCINEYIARRANKEDECKGRFWEGRFKSQALLDETALISCMAYVDLNPIRAMLCDDLHSSDFTSVQQRLQQAMKKSTGCKPRLMPFREKQSQDQRFHAVPFNLQDYIDLVDWTGRHIRADKRGHILAHKPKILATLALSSNQWQILALEIQKKPILMLNGLDTLANIEKRSRTINKAT